MDKWTRGSGAIASSQVVTAKEGVLKGILVGSDGTNAVTLDLYDNASAASGVKVIPTLIITTSAVDRAQYIPLPDILFINGLYLELTCSGTVGVVVYYRNT